MTDDPPPPAAAEQPLLLHSLKLLDAEILACLDAVGPSHIIEIGSESGGFTAELASWAQTHDATLSSVDPAPAPRTRALAASNPALQLVEGLSPAALEGLAPAQVYVIDGDHNYWTVRAELQHAFGDVHVADPLAVLHDVGWPCARRDQYYSPEAIPEAARHEHVYHGGIVPGRSAVVDVGFSGGGNFAYATHEGGERNGVLTAVEDLLGERQDLEYMSIASVFGVGFVFPREAPWADEVRAVIRPLHDRPLLAALERNRMDLYVTVLQLQASLERHHVRSDRLIADWQERLGVLEAENASLRLQEVQRADQS